jgi:hypothetical protein
MVFLELKWTEFELLSKNLTQASASAEKKLTIWSHSLVQLKSDLNVQQTGLGFLKMN